MLRAILRAIPNLVSLSRLALGAAFIVADERGARAVIVLAAALTDMVDGWIARAMKTQSRAGALIDPIADRAFVFAAVSTCLFEGQISTGEYFTLLTRDLANAIGFLVARAVPWLRPITFRARASGKVTTGLQMVALIAVLVRPAWVAGLVVGVGVLSVWAIVDYTWMLWRERDRKPESPA